MSFIFTKLGSTLLVIALIAFGYFLFTAIGDTTINVTLKTNTDLERGLVGHWTFDGKDMTSNVADSSGQGNDGSLELGASGNTSTTTAIGVIGQALEFDGTDDSITLPLMSTILSDVDIFTVSAWVYLNDVTNRQVIWAEVDNNGFGDPNGVFEFNVDDTNIGFYPSSRNQDTVIFAHSDVKGWYHFVGVKNTVNSAEFFVDGVSAGSPTTPVAAGTNGTHYIGRPASSERYFNGLMDDVRIYNRALSAEEIKRLYELGATTHVNVTIPPAAPVAGGPDLQSGLVGHWTFDGKDTDWGLNTVTDKSGQGNTGTITNMSTTSSPTFGVLGQALEFDGVDDYVKMGSILDAPAQFTLSAWINLNQSNSNKGVVAKWQSNSGYMLWLTSDSISLPINGGPHLTADSALTVGEWAHVVGTYDGTNARIYVNGVIDASPQAESTPNSTVSNLHLGVYGSGPLAGTYMDAKLDDVRIYNRALSAEEIKRLYELGATTHVNVTIPPAAPAAGGPDLQSGLVGHWTFDGKDTDWGSNTVTDSSGQGNTGTITNMSTTSSPTFGKIGQALQFDGSDDYVNVPALDCSLTNQFTISVWVYPTVDNTSNMSIFVKGTSGTSPSLTDYGIYTNNFTSDWFADVSDGTIELTARATGNSFKVNQWQHLTSVFSGSDKTIYLYVDGVLADSDYNGSFTTCANNRNPSAISSDGWSGSHRYFFPGLIDDVRVYNRALSAEEVSRLYDMGR